MERPLSRDDLTKVPQLQRRLSRDLARLPQLERRLNRSEDLVGRPPLQRLVRCLESRRPLAAAGYLSLKQRNGYVWYETQHEETENLSDHLRVSDIDPATLPDWQAAGIIA